MTAEEQIELLELAASDIRIAEYLTAPACANRRRRTSDEI